MPVQKFKSFDEASRALWNFNPGHDYFRNIASFYRLSLHLSKTTATKGIFKFHNQQEANDHRLLETKNSIGKL